MAVAAQANETLEVPAPAPIEAGAAEETSEQTEPFAAPSESPALTEGSRRRTVKPVTVSDGSGANSEPNDSGTVDWLESIEANEPDLPEQGRLPRGANTHVFILYVVARREEALTRHHASRLILNITIEGLRHQLSRLVHVIERFEHIAGARQSHKEHEPSCLQRLHIINVKHARLHHIGDTEFYCTTTGRPLMSMKKIHITKAQIIL